MNFRQIHLDFHTSEKIDGIGSNFSKEQFQSALKRGHVNSITVFSKCHHGWAYHPSEANEMHPGLSFDLLGAQIEAAHEIGVKTPVYLSAGLDEKMTRRHPEWLRRGKDDRISWENPGYHEFCMNSPYLDYLIAQIEEVVRTYDCDGIFLDIVGVRTCWCQNCVKTLLDEGKDPYNDDNVRELGERIYANYCRRVREAVDAIKPGLPVFHNSGHIRRGRRDLADVDTHLELESLPTGGWGYDHFPLSAAYSRTLGKQFLGMTGKFHTSWGEFGGFKHPNALRYEEALCVANGAKCSVGDQMHPDGYMEEATYDLIGAAYAEVESKEPWLDDVTSVADIAILSEEAIANYYAEGNIPHHGGADSDAGAVRIMLEGKYLFDVIDTQEPLDKYKLLILPDRIRLDEALTAKIRAFTKKGGKILAAGESALTIGGGFAFDFGCDFVGACAYRPAYVRPQFELDCLGNSAYVIYAQSYDITAKDGAEVLLNRENPYFNRSTFAFSSHRHTPNDKSASYPAAVLGKDGAYIAADLFSEYAQMGNIYTKRILTHVIDVLLGEAKTLRTDLPAQGVVTLMDQKGENRLVNHVLYASPVRRGKGIEIIEDIIPLYNVSVSVKTDKSPKRVYLAPEMKDLAYTYENGTVSYTLEKLDLHAMVVIDY
ncbi:MAG: beta-galactosidase trimerization domain-containing protein [Clostridia bacterium]|nr:beta-galactosidase trimerization domain-containing protein [Clostridia bacterium]